MSGEQILFILMALLMVFSSVLMVHARHPVYSAIFMVVTMFGVAANFILLDSFFLGVIQILVYAGAIMILFLFIIMLLNVDQEGTYQPSLSGAGICLAAAFAGNLGAIIIQSGGGWKTVLYGEAGGTLTTPAQAKWILDQGVLAIGNLSTVLFRQHWFPFEAISMLLLSAIVGVVVLSKRRLD